MNSSTSASFDIAAIVAEASNSGKEERARRNKKAADDQAQIAERLAAEVPERVHRTLESLPGIIRDAVVRSDKKVTTVCVMWLEEHEFAGQFYWDEGTSFDDQTPIDPADLKLAGKSVFAALDLAGLNPVVKRDYKPIGPDDYGSSRRYPGIFLTVS